MYGTQQTSSRTDWQGGLTTPRRNRLLPRQDDGCPPLRDGDRIRHRDAAHAQPARVGLWRLVRARRRVPATIPVRCASRLARRSTGGGARSSCRPRRSRCRFPPRSSTACAVGRSRATTTSRRSTTVDRREAIAPQAASANADERDDEGRHEHEGHGHDDDDEACVTVLLCYHECESDPVAVLAGDCSTSTPCAPSSIREQYRIDFEAGCTDPVEISCRFPDVLRRGEIDYGALARWVTQECLRHR